MWGVCEGKAGIDVCRHGEKRGRALNLSQFGPEHEWFIELCCAENRNCLKVGLPPA